jgi:hypothetical protein
MRDSIIKEVDFTWFPFSATHLPKLALLENVGIQSSSLAFLSMQSR